MTTTTMAFTPKGPFDLQNQNSYFNSWPATTDGRIVMAFPAEGTWEPALVTLRQTATDTLTLEMQTGVSSKDQVRKQALAALSLDEDGTGWPEVGRRDPIMGRLQDKFRYVRPSLFHSPYEAAAAFIIGHRISIAQGRRIRAALAEAIGTSFEVGGLKVSSFPSPQSLLDLREFKGLSEIKVSRLHGVAEAAGSGLLDRDSLRALDEREALEQLRGIPGIGPFFAQGILHRGAGTVDALTADRLTSEALQRAYSDGAPLSAHEMETITGRWTPYRMWAVVQLHLWYRQTIKGGD